MQYVYCIVHSALKLEKSAISKMQKNLICIFKNGKKSISAQEKSLKLPKMQLLHFFLILEHCIVSSLASRTSLYPFARVHLRFQNDMHSIYFFQISSHMNAMFSSTIYWGRFKKGLHIRGDTDILWFEFPANNWIHSYISTKYLKPAIGIENIYHVSAWN